MRSYLIYKSYTHYSFILHNLNIYKYFQYVSIVKFYNKKTQIISLIKINTKKKIFIQRLF